MVISNSRRFGDNSWPSVQPGNRVASLARSHASYARTQDLRMGVCFPGWNFGKMPASSSRLVFSSLFVSVCVVSVCVRLLGPVVFPSFFSCSLVFVLVMPQLISTSINQQHIEASESAIIVVRHFPCNLRMTCW